LWYFPLVPRDVLALAGARRSAPALPASLAHHSPVAIIIAQMLDVHSHSPLLHLTTPSGE